MKLFPGVIGFLVVCVTGSANAQTGSTAAAIQNLDAERQRIATEQSALEARSNSERVACYKKFFVNSCLDEVDEQRRLGMSGLRRQEIMLNDQERKARGDEQLRQLEEKALQQSRQRAAETGAVPASVEKPASGPDRDKPESRTPPPQPVRADSGTSARKERSSLEKADVIAETAAAKAQEFAKRQKKAQERREAHEQAQRSRTKPSAAPLPASP